MMLTGRNVELVHKYSSYDHTKINFFGLRRKMKEIKTNGSFLIIVSDIDII